MLNVSNLNSHYGRAHILHDVSFSLQSGEVLALLGRNGAGKSTVMKSLIGLVRPASGKILLRDMEITRRAPDQIARLGLGYVPEERRIFTDLTVLQNLEIGRRQPRAGLTPWTPERLFALFPNLGEMRDRPGGRMSGGEQQMLTIARSLMGNPQILLLDEPSEGLSPLIVEQMAAAIMTLKAEGLTILLAEQNLHFAGAVASYAAIIESGKIMWTGEMPVLTADKTLLERYLAV